MVLRYVQPPGHTYQPKLPGRHSMEAAEEKLLKAYKAKAKQWRRQVGQYRRAKQKQTKVQGKKPYPVK